MELNLIHLSLEIWTNPSLILLFITTSFKHKLSSDNQEYDKFEHWRPSNQSGAKVRVKFGLLLLAWGEELVLWLMVARSGLCMMVYFSIKHNLQLLVEGLKSG